jgi:hypothetical protein
MRIGKAESKETNVTQFSISHPHSSKLRLRDLSGVAAHPMQRRFDDPAQHALDALISGANNR